MSLILLLTWVALTRASQANANSMFSLPGLYVLEVRYGILTEICSAVLIHADNTLDIKIEEDSPFLKRVIFAAYDFTPEIPLARASVSLPRLLVSAGALNDFDPEIMDMVFSHFNQRLRYIECSDCLSLREVHVCEFIGSPQE